MNTHHNINYVELPSTDLEKTKTFFTEVFNWNFKDFGSDYCAFNQAGIEGGFYLSEWGAATQNSSALVVIYSEDLDLTLEKVKENGGTIVKDIFSFPGGKRFQFLDPGGSEFGVWSEL